MEILVPVFSGIFTKPLTFFLGEDIEAIKYLLEGNGIWCSSISYGSWDGFPAGVFDVKRSQYRRALGILREAGIL